ncbi:ABC transporter substrate-binding protein [Brevibacillus agri]|uniref:ABC transporter substrate-binding protein n=1 Tax=Brevibacillus agri TaxID=51101 RepID=UPI0025B678C2|nr:ABC transporter substrate-binding protein [Brevibacillus agri]MDN4093076.1 ABC transporter substrate-binding protein [Brevibacillus agri]
MQLFRNGTKGKMHKLMLGLALLLSACSSPGNGGAVNSSPPQSTQQTTEASAAANAQQAKQQQWPRTYVDATGKEVVIAKQPQRVAVTHFGMMEYFFALETPPIASTLAERMLGSFETLKPYAKTATVKDIGEVTTPNLELMTELEPDLIVAFSGTHNDVYEDLSHISTVAMINNTEERTWAETLREYAKLICKEQLAEDYITKLEALMAEAGEKLAAKKDKTVTFLRASGDGSTFYVLDDNDVSYAFDEKSGLGLKPPGQYKLEGDVVSLEGITVLDPDYIFLVDYLDNMDTTLAELNKSKVWQSLNVSISTKGPLAVEYTTKELLRVLAE